MNRRLKRALTIGVSAAAVMLVVAGLGLWYLYHSVERTVTLMYEEPVKPPYVSSDSDIILSPAPAQQPVLKPLTILLLGVDERKNDAGRSDTMVVMSINPNKKSILIFHIPRDTKTEIIGRRTFDKINHAYAFGGVPMSIQTVENFLDFPIDYYVKVNMEGFARAIDLLGGVTVRNPFSFSYEGHDFRSGELQLNGAEALLYTRMRMDDPKGDLGRNERQKQVIAQFFNTATDVSILTKIRPLLDEAGNSIKTNLTFKDLKNLFLNYRPQIAGISSDVIKGSGIRTNGIWYYQVDTEERARIHNRIKEHQS